jgi:anti-anti-sigma factor
MTATVRRDLPADGQPPTAASVTGSLTDDVLTITVSGNLDAAAQSTLQHSLSDILASHRPRHVIVDVAGVDFCDSAGARMLSRAEHVTTAGGSSFAIHDPQPHVAWVLRITGATAGGP